MLKISSHSLHTALKKNENVRSFKFINKVITSRVWCLICVLFYFIYFYFHSDGRPAVLEAVCVLSKRKYPFSMASVDIFNLT